MNAEEILEEVKKRLENLYNENVDVADENWMHYVFSAIETITQAQNSLKEEYNKGED